MNSNIFTVLTDTELGLPYYMTSAGGWTNQENTVRTCGFPDFQWIQCLSGEGVLETDGQQFTVHAGQGMFLYPNRKHRYYAAKEPWVTQWITFNGAHSAAMLSALNLTGSSVLQLSHPELVEKKLLLAHELLRTGHHLRNIRCSALLYEIVLDLFMYSSTPELRSKTENYEQLMPVLAYMDDHYSQSLTLETLSKLLNVSPQYTCHLFQKAFGLRPFEYINRFRLRKAKELLLLKPEQNIKDIANWVGYEHPSYFIKLFKQQEGITPSAFRKIHGQ